MYDTCNKEYSIHIYYICKTTGVTQVYVLLVHYMFR